MPNSKKPAKRPRRPSAPALPVFSPGEVVVLYEPGAPFGELCHAFVTAASPAEVVVGYYGSPLVFRPTASVPRVWATEDGRWNVDRRTPERTAASLRLRCGTPPDGCDPGVANDNEE